MGSDASSAPGSVGVAPNVPMPILLIVDKDLSPADIETNGSQVSQAPNDPPGSQGEASGYESHAPIAPPLVASPSSLSTPTVGKEGNSNDTKEAEAEVLTESAGPAAITNNKGSDPPKSISKEDPEPEGRSQTPTGTRPSLAAESKAPHIRSSSSTASTPLSSPASSPSKSSRSKSSGLLGTWKKGRRFSSPLVEAQNGHSDGLERHGSKASSGASGSNDGSGNGTAGSRKRRSSFFEKVKDLFHHHGKEKSGDSI